MLRQAHVVSGSTDRFSTISLRIRRGGPRKHMPTPNHDDRSQTHKNGDNTMNMLGSHMPLDTMLHWQWSNPLNILPLLVAVSLILALIGMMV